MTKKWMRLLAALLAISLVAAACGGDDADDAVSSDAETDVAGGDADADDAVDDAADADADGDADADADAGDATETEDHDATEAEDVGNVEIDESANCAAAVELEVGDYAPSGHADVGMGFILTGGFNPHNNQAPAASPTTAGCTRAWSARTESRAPSCRGWPSASRSPKPATRSRSTCTRA